MRRYFPLAIAFVLGALIGAHVTESQHAIDCAAVRRAVRGPM